MANKYLDQAGLEYFWGKIKTFFTGTATPSAPGTAAVGTSSKLAREDHVHPAQTSVSGNAGTATKLATKRTIDGVDFDGSAAIIHFGTCSTAAATTEKAVACTGYKLVTGSWIAVKFTVTNTGAVASLTLNVNSTGAKAIKYRGGNLPKVATLTSGVTYMFVYDGTNYELIGDLDTNTTYTPASATPLMDGTGAVGSSAKYAREDHVHPTDTSRAPLASPTFTGTPKAPTASAGTNTTQIATTAFVTTAVANAQVGAATFQGTVSSNSTISDSAYKKGWYWVVATAGTYVGETCEVGDMIFAIADKGSAYSASDFSVIQSNLDLVAITNAEIDAIAV